LAEIILACDQQNATKPMDDFLGFRRRLRLFMNAPVEPYRTHMKDTQKRLPDYIVWLRSERERFGDGPWQQAVLLKGYVDKALEKL
jgi:hypothetical protein